jgi:general secretion pathway protein E
MSTGGQAEFLSRLVKRKQLSDVLAERVARVQLETADRLCAVILKLGLLSEEALSTELSVHVGLPLLSARDMPARATEIEGFNPQFAHAHEVIPLRLEPDTLEIACWDGLDDFPARALKFSLGRQVHRHLATRSEVQRALQRLYPVENGGGGALPAAGALEEDEVERLKDLARDAPVIRLVQSLIDRAIALKASDIHIEPSEIALHVRLRLDGLLREVDRAPRTAAGPVVSRIKVMAGLNIAERRLPQDGRIRVTAQGKEIDFRVATTPTLHGESVVLRILDRQDVALDFAALGFDEPLIRTLREAIQQPFGIVLVTGPTGSGKTTTLYAALKEINTPERKILTVEDPVEYVLAGINQVPVRPQIGLTFAQALRAFLRQDPDVLMVGEIRDRETAQIAVQAALTGHLLLSTLHTNTASSAVTRLLDMGVENYLLTSTLHAVLGQRLLRRLCLECRDPYVPDEETRAHFNLTAGRDLTWHRPKGCAACDGTGYRGRTSIIEALRVTDGVRSQILAQADAPSIEKVALQEGMRTMLQHGLERVAAGITTVEEVLRVTRLN